MASMASSEEEVQRVETEASAPEILSENAPSSRSAIRVAISYVAESERELSVTTVSCLGDLVSVENDSQDGLVYCTDMETNKRGLLPAECLESSDSPSSHRRRGQRVDKGGRPSFSPEVRRRAKVEMDINSEEVDGLVLSRSRAPAAVEETESKLDFSDIERHGIISVGGTDREGRPVIVSSACKLPASHNINHHRLLELLNLEVTVSNDRTKDVWLLTPEQMGYLKSTLDQYVESDYTLVYFHHGLNSSNKPGVRWLMSAYREFDRKYKKNMKKLYIVHPSTFIKIVMGVFRPVISAKFGRKVSYVNRLYQLSDTLYVDQLDIPDPVREHDAELCAKDKPRPPAQGQSVFHTSLSVGIQETHQFGVSLAWLKEHSNGDNIPKAVRLCIEYIRANVLDVQGIFRRAASAATVRQIKEKMNRGEDIDFGSFFDPHIPCVILKTFLRELPEPLLTFALCEPMTCLLQDESSTDKKAAAAKKLLHEHLPPQNYEVLKYIMQFLAEVSSHSADNKMDESNLAIVFGPNLLWSPNETASLTSMGYINTFTRMLITQYSFLFEN